MNNQLCKAIGFIALWLSTTVLHAQTTITSDVSGNWNSSSTWIGGVVPGATNNVVVSAGDTVTIDVATASCLNLTVQGTVFFINDGSSTGITVNGDVDVQSGAVVRARARSVPVLYTTTPTAHSLTIYGNLTNAGTLDLREGSNGSSGQTTQTIRICNMTFAGTSNSTINLRYSTYQTSGEEFNSVTINKTGGAKVILASGNLFMNNNSNVGACLLTFTSGIIETYPSSVWVLLPTASGSIVGASTTRYVSGALGRGLNSSQGTDRKIDIGDDEGYRPISVRSTIGSGSGHYVYARLMKGNANTGGSTLVGGIDSVSRYRYYQVGYVRGSGGAANMLFDQFAPSYKSDDGVEEGLLGVMVAYSVDNRVTWTNAGPGNHVVDLSNPPTALQSSALSSPITVGDGGSYYVSLAWGPASTTGIIPDVANRSYGPYAMNKFDLWKASSATPTPLVIWIHGGGLKSGSKADVSTVLIERLLAAGISVMSINYRLTPEAQFPMHFMDCARALQYVRLHASEFNIDPERIGLGGSSAGALTSFWLGFHNDLADPANPDSVLRMSTRVKALACWSGQTSLDRRVIGAWVGPIVLTYNTYFDGQMFGIPADSIDTPTGYALQEAISPVNYVTPDDPPVWMYYSQVNTATTSSEAIHHIGFGTGLKTKVDSVGVQCSLLSPLTYSGSITDSAVAFYVKNVKDAPLPVQLASFAGRRLSAHVVRLNWLTLSEVNNYGFEVQRRTSPQGSYETVANSFIPGHGTTSEPHAYSYLDSMAFDVQAWYRLRQIDSDATVHFSEPIIVQGLTDVGEIGRPEKFYVGQNFPNPFNPSTQIVYGLPQDARVTLKVYNTLGQEVQTVVDQQQTAGVHVARFTASGLPSGVYFYRLQANGFLKTNRMLLVK